MRFAGYLNALKENSFAIPVYTDSSNYYFHKVNENYKITEFHKVENINGIINEGYLSKHFDINDFGVYVFVGRNNYLNYNILSESINEVDKYLNETTDKDKFLSIKEDVALFLKYLERSSAFTLEEVKIEDVISQNIFERKRNLRSSIYMDSWVNFSGNLNPINNDISSIILEDYFDKFTNQLSTINDLLTHNEELRVRFVEYLSNNNDYLKLKDFLDSKSIADSCLILGKKSLKDYNHQFKNSKKDGIMWTIVEGSRGNTTIRNIEDLDSLNLDTLKKEKKE